MDSDIINKDMSHQPDSVAEASETIPSSQSQNDNLDNFNDMSEIIPNQGSLGLPHSSPIKESEDKDKFKSVDRCTNGAIITEEDGDIVVDKGEQSLSNSTVDADEKTIKNETCNKGTEASVTMDTEELCLVRGQVIPNIDEKEKSVNSLNGKDSSNNLEESMSIDTEEPGSQQSQIIPNMDECNKTIQLTDCTVGNGKEMQNVSMDDQQTENELQLFLDED